MVSATCLVSLFCLHWSGSVTSILYRYIYIIMKCWVNWASCSSWSDFRHIRQMLLLAEMVTPLLGLELENAEREFYSTLVFLAWIMCEYDVKILQLLPFVFSVKKPTFKKQEVALHQNILSKATWLLATIWIRHGEIMGWKRTKNVFVRSLEHIVDQIRDVVTPCGHQQTRNVFLWIIRSIYHSWSSRKS